MGELQTSYQKQWRPKRKKEDIFKATKAVKKAFNPGFYIQ